MKAQKQKQKPQVDREQKKKNIQRVVITVVSVIIILAWILGLVVNM